MYCSDNAERLRLDNLLSFMLHALVFFKYHLHFPSYPYSDSLQYPTAVLSSTGTPLMKIVIKTNYQLQMVVRYEPISLRIRSPPRVGNW